MAAADRTEHEFVLDHVRLALLAVVLVIGRSGREAVCNAYRSLACSVELLLLYSNLISRSQKLQDIRICRVPSLPVCLFENASSTQYGRGLCLPPSTPQDTSKLFISIFQITNHDNVCFPERCCNCPVKAGHRKSRSIRMPASLTPK